MGPAVTQQPAEPICGILTRRSRGIELVCLWIESKLLERTAIRREIQSIIEENKVAVDGEAAIAEILNILVLDGVEVTQVVAIQKINLSAFVSREHQMRNGALLIRH